MIHIPKSTTPLTKENILKLVDEGSLFNFYLPNLQVGRTMLSPLRRESSPSFYITNHDGHYYFKDLGDGTLSGDVWRFIMLSFNISFLEALALVNRDFGLGLDGEPQKDYKRIIKALPRQKEKKHSVISEVVREWRKEDLEWWKKRLQTIEELERENIVSFERAYINDSEIIQSPTELAFCYDFKEIDKKKLYFPERGQRKGKWYGSVPAGYVEGLEYIKDAEKIIITGGKKDRMVCMKFFPYVCNTQNESNIAFTPEFRELISGKEVYLFYDNDETGKKQSGLLASEFGYKELFVPEETQTKDIDEWVVERGIYPITEFFFEHKILI